MTAIQDIFELTPVQQAMLMRILLEQDSTSYVEQTRYQLRNLGDPQLLIRAWQLVVRERAALRTSFHWDGLSEPVQAVHENVGFSVEMLDWSDCDASTQGQRLERHFEYEKQRGFDLGKPPLMRVFIVKMGDGCFDLLWTRHHLLLDRWSRRLVLEDVGDACNALCAGREPVLRSRPEFSSYAASLEPPGEAARTFWQRMLRGAAAIDVWRPARAGSGDVVRTHLELSRDESERLRGWSRVNRVTLASVLHGLWALTIRDMGGLPTVVFGSVESGRARPIPQIDRVIGTLITTLPVCLQPRVGQSYADFLFATQSLLSELTQFAGTPLADIERWCDWPGSEPLFQSLLVIENVAGDLSHGDDGVRFNAVSGFGGTDGAPLMAFVETGPAIRLELVDSTGSLSSAQRGDLVRAFRRHSRRCVEHDSRILPLPQVEGDAGQAVEALPDRADEAGVARTMPELRLLNIWRSIMHCACGPEDDFRLLGGSSLSLIRLLRAVHEEFGVDIPLNEFFANPTVRGLAKLLSRPMNGEARPETIIPVAGGNGGATVFFVPGGGGGELEMTMVYHELVLELGAEFTVVGLDAARAMGDGASSLEEIGSRLAADLLAYRPGAGPWYLVGECNGSLVALEVARRLMAVGESVAFLGMLDPSPPGRTAMLRVGLRQLGQTIMERLNYGRWIVGRLRAHLRALRLQGLPGRLYAGARGAKSLLSATEELAAVHARRRRYQRLMHAYRPLEYAGRVTILMSGDPGRANPVPGWTGIARGGVNVEQLGGDHYSYVRGQFRATASRLRSCLNRALRENLHRAGPVPRGYK